MASLSDILSSLSAGNPEEETLLQSVFGLAESFLTRGQKDPGLALTALRSSSNPALPELLTSLPEESRTQFFGLVEALEIYQSTHGSVGSVLSLNEGAVGELRKIRDICLQGLTHAYY